MQQKAILRVISILLMMFSLVMLPPAAVAFWTKDHQLFPFLFTFALVAGVGLLIFLPVMNHNKDLKPRDGFIIVALFWTVLSAVGALPFMLSYDMKLSFIDAFFEATSGLTTTGSTVLQGIDFLPSSVRFYRQQLQLFGGMGIIVLAVAILPTLGVGGMQLYQAEMPGPVKDNKLTPRLAESAKTLWVIYMGLIVACAFCYWLVGLPFFEALGESFSTVATGGFSMHDASLGYYQSVNVDVVADVFMVLGASNFALHYYALRQRTLSVYWQDIEWRSYMMILLGVSIAVIWALLSHYHALTFGTILREGIFTVVSVATTTGLSVVDFSVWPTFLPVGLMILGLMGGCAGSTSGGVKVIRMLLLQKQGARELKRMIHPKAIFAIKFGDQGLTENVVQSIWGFIAIFITVYIFLLLALLITGLDFTTAFGALNACISNTGIGLGDTASGFGAIPSASKGVLIFAMLAGRLEVFSLLVLFLPEFWRQ